MPAKSIWIRLATASAVVAALACGGVAARAADVIDEWSTIQMPPAPTLKAVTVDPKTTALLLFDFMTENCGQRPRCVAAVPALKAIHDRARAAGMMVVYTLPSGGKIIDPGMTPREGEVLNQTPGGPNKFLGDDLDQHLKAHPIKPGIRCGTPAGGVGRAPGGGGVQRGY